MAVLIQALEFSPRPSSAPAGGDCSRHLSREAVEIVESDILSYALQKGVSVSATCPLHPDNSRYARQELLKKELRHGLWECDGCKKRFRAERWLDAHLDRQHKESVTSSECMADYCGLLGCPGLVTSGAYELESIETAEDGLGDADDVSVSASPPAIAPAQHGPSPRGNDDSETESEQGPNAPQSTALPAGASTLRRMRGQSGRTAGSDSVGWDTSGLYASRQSGAAPSGHVHDTTHRNALAARHGTLTPRQKRERARCTAIITSCFPAPPDTNSTPATRQPLGTSPDNSATKELTPRAGAVNATTASGTMTKAKQLLRRVPVQQPREVVLATRHELVSRFCDRTILTKAVQWTDRKNAESSRRTTFYIITIVIGCSILLAWLLHVLDQAPGPGARRRGMGAKEAEEAAAMIALMQKKYETPGLAHVQSSSKAASSAVRRTTAAADESQNIGQGRRTSAGQRKGR